MGTEDNAAMKGTTGMKGTAAVEGAAPMEGMIYIPAENSLRRTFRSSFWRCWSTSPRMGTS
jgi:hypothetical protein